MITQFVYITWTHTFNTNLDVAQMYLSVRQTVYIKQCFYLVTLIKYVPIITSISIIGSWNMDIQNSHT